MVQNEAALSLFILLLVVWFNIIKIKGLRMILDYEFEVDRREIDPTSGDTYT